MPPHAAASSFPQRSSLRQSAFLISHCYHTAGITTLETFQYAYRADLRSIGAPSASEINHTYDTTVADATRVRVESSVHSKWIFGHIPR